LLFDEYVQDSKSLGKPFILEEFGKIVNKEDVISLRNNFYKAAYEVAEEYAEKDGILQGTLFWHWCVTSLYSSPWLICNTKSSRSFAFKITW
jgi:hypothetical protein